MVPCLTSGWQSMIPGCDEMVTVMVHLPVHSQEGTVISARKTLQETQAPAQGLLPLPL